MSAPDETSLPSRKPWPLATRLPTSFGRVVVAVAALTVSGYALGSCQDLEAPPRLTDAQGTGLTTLAIAVVQATLSGNRQPPPSQEGLGTTVVTDPVFVTVYGPSRDLRRDPVVGRWSPFRVSLPPWPRSS